MSRRLIIPLALALAALGSGLVIAATSAKPDFSLIIVPDSQSVPAGQAATYGIGIEREAGFTRGVSLKVSGLPPTVTASVVKGVINGLAPTGMTRRIRAARARCLATANRRTSARRRKRARATCFATADRRAAVLKIVPLQPSMPARLRLTRTAALILSTNQGGVTPPGTYGFTVTGTSSGSRTVATTKGTLLVLPTVAGTPNFGVNVSPADQTIVQSDAASFDVSVLRSGGFTGPVSLSAPSLPPGVSASFAPATVQGAEGAVMTLSTVQGIKTGAYSVWVVATGTAGGVPLTRLGLARLVVEENKRFAIAGDVPELLNPGIGSPLDLAVTNPHKFAIAVRDLTVALDPETDRPQCSATDNFAVEQIPPGGFPIVVPAGATRKLTEAGVTPQSLPRVTMRDLPTNQDACKGARLQLRYSGNATKP